MNSSSPTTFRERRTVEAMPWDGTLAAAQHVVEWLQTSEGVNAQYIANRFGDACIQIEQPGLEPTYLMPNWFAVRDENDEFWAMDPFQFRADYGPDDRSAEEALDRIRIMRDRLQLNLDGNKNQMPGPIVHIYKSFIALIDETIEGSGE